MSPVEPLLSPVPEPIDPKTRVDAAAVGPLSRLALEATVAGGALHLPARARGDLGDHLPALLASGALIEVGEGALVIPDHGLRLALAASALADEDELPEDVVGRWLDRGFEGIATHLCAELARRGQLDRAGDVVHWISGHEAPGEVQLLTAHVTAAAALYGAARASGAALPAELFEAPLGELSKRFSPELPLVTWEAVVDVLGSLGRLGASPGPEVRQILKEFSVQVASLVAELDPEAAQAHWLWHLQGLLLGAALTCADAGPDLVEMILTQQGDESRQLRPLVAVQLRVGARSAEVARLLDALGPRADALGLRPDWLLARASASPDEGARAAILDAVSGPVAEEGDAERVAAAISAATALTSLDAPLRDALVGRLTTGFLAEACAAAHALEVTQEGGDEVAGPLRDALKARGPAQAKAAAALLTLGHAVGEAAPVALAHLARWLGDPDAEASDGPALIDTLGDAGASHPEVRGMLLRAVDEEGLTAAALLALASAAERLWVREDAAPWERDASAAWRAEVVALALGRIPDAPPPLRRLLTRCLGFCLRGADEAPAVALVNVLAAEADAGAAQLLPAVGAAQVAAEAVVKRLVRGMDHDDPQVLTAACAGAGYLVDGWFPDATLLEGWPELFDALMACVEVGDVDVSEAAGRALWRLSRQRVPEE